MITRARNFRVLATLAVVALAGCHGGAPTDEDGGIVLENSARDAVVKNGTAYDRASVDLSGCETLAVPDSATVRQDNSVEKMQIYMKKRLAFMGHPPRAMNPTVARRNMGCAYKVEGATITIATYGEWNSKEGGASIGVTLVAPARIKVVRAPGLSGENSPAASKGESTESDGYWYVRGEPESGWLGIKSEPDPEFADRK